MSFRVVGRRVWFLAIVSMFGVCSFRAAAQDGIYADFTTSMGNITCRLDYAIAPIAVANFIGLATGQQSWVDMTTGVVKSNRYYDGLIFHRVIAGFMIQGGSPNGLGTDGPGYVFPDEFDTSLRFNSFGVLAMANTGDADANGSQFFITGTNNTSWLNDHHTIFGRLVGGSNVVWAINHVQTDDTDKPVTDVTLQNIQIRRVGSAAQAFDIHQQGLPTLTNLPVQIQKAATNEICLGFRMPEYAVNRVFSSTNMHEWSQEYWKADVADPQTNQLHRSLGAAQKFYAVAQVKYPAKPYGAATLFKRKMTLKVTGSSGTITINFDAAGKGTVSYSGQSANVVSYTWSQHFFGGGDLWPITFSAYIYPLYIRIYFTTATSGDFRGWASNPNTGWQPIKGTFTLTAPQ